MAALRAALSRPLTNGHSRGRSEPRARSTGNGVRAADFEDRFISRLLESCFPAERTQFSAFQKKCLTALSTAHMPTRRDEAFRFTDVSPILQASVKKPRTNIDLEGRVTQQLCTGGDEENRVIILNGNIQWDLSSLQPDLSDCALKPGQPLPLLQMGEQSTSRGGTFTTLNGALFTDALCLVIPPGVKIARPLHVVYLSSGESNDVTVSAPRVFVRCEEGSRLELVEEFLTLDAASSSHLAMAVCEIDLLEEAELQHHYVQLDGPSAFHVKSTFVRQASNSVYRLVESSIGSKISRHDLSIEQGGDSTETEMDHFHLSGDAQLHDLHTRVKLDHVSGIVNQLHKCIVTSSAGSGVFDGNVQVNQNAQKTDAGQLSRNLLLAPKATVNVKPNLQIVADDVKCTHGCTVSDLSEDEVFYFRARGIDQEAARRALVYSFGSEVNQKLTSDALRQRIEQAVLNTLENV